MVENSRRDFNELVIKFQRVVFRVAFAVVRSMEDADEITQEVFLKLHLNIDRIEKPEAIKSWLIRTAINTSRDRLRWQKVRGWFKGATQDPDRITSADGSPERLAAAKERTRILGDWTAANLSAKERTTFQLKYGEEMTIAEIAEALSMNQNTVKTHLHRAMNKIKKLERGDEDER
jgi:RNA polymerase sigma-70 factor (ECF subfamily)